MTGAFDDPKQLARFARGVDVVTFDWENVPVAVRCARSRGCAPCLAAAARAATSRRTGCPKSACSAQLGIPDAPVRGRGHAARTCTRAIAALGLPGVLKTRRLGYDGKGQVRIRARARRRGGLASARRASR